MEDDGNRGRSLLGLVVVLAVVAAVGWFARPPGPSGDERNPDELAIDDPPTGPSPAASPTTGTEPFQTPDTLRTPETLAIPETERAPAGSAPDAFEDLSEVLEVMEGEWREIEVEVDLGTHDDPRSVAVWDGAAMVVIGSDGAGRYEPNTGTWQELPSPPADGPATTRQAVSVDGQVVVLQTDELRDATTQRKASYRLDGDAWVDLDIPGGLVLGTTDEAMVMTRREPGVDGGVNPSDLALVDPTDRTVENIPDPPEALVRIGSVIGLDDGLMVLGEGLPMGRGTAADPIGSGGQVAFRWSSADGWHRLPDPPARLAGLFLGVPVDTGGQVDRVVALEPRPSVGLGLAIFDLTMEEWSLASFELPARYDPLGDDRDRTLLVNGQPSVAGETVWVHVRAASRAVQGSIPTNGNALLAWDLETGQFAVAEGAGLRLGPSMASVWVRLILAGGVSTGVGEQRPLVQEWTPADGPESIGVDWAPPHRTKGSRHQAGMTHDRAETAPMGHLGPDRAQRALGAGRALGPRPTAAPT